MNEITVEAKVENLDRVTAFVDACLEAVDCPMKVQMQIDIAVEEVFVNIASYAYFSRTGTAVIQVEIEDEGSVAAITFIDSGMAYDPLQHEDPDVTLSVEQRPIGGLGIFMVKKSMDEMTYARLEGKNVLTIRKRIR